MDDLNSIWCPADELHNINDDEVVPLNAGSFSQNTNDSDDTFHIEQIPDEIIKEVVDDSDSCAFLPSRIDCSAHNLNLIGKLDAFGALNDKLYAARYVSVFKKLNAIWKKNSTRKGREIFDHYLRDYKIIKPHRIRWNRIYDAVSD